MRETARRERTARYRLTLACALLASAAAACDSIPSKPEYGAIRVTIAWTGDDEDVEGVRIFVDDGPGRAPWTPGELSLSLEAGKHTVALQGTASTCTVSDPAAQRVSVAAGQVAEVHFEVSCRATGIAVTTRTTGIDVPVEYEVAVDGRSTVPIAPNGSLTLRRLTPGSYAVTLLAPEHCAVADDGRTVTVTAQTLTPVAFEITCGPVVRPQKIAYMSYDDRGASSLPWLETVHVDGTRRQRLRRGEWPDWSPDGTRIVASESQCVEDSYYGYGTGTTCSGSLYYLDPELGSVMRAGSNLAALRPAWARTGDAIVFETPSADGKSSALNVLRPSSGSVVELSVAGVPSPTEAAWSPDGRRLAFVCLVGAVRGLYVMNADGTDVTRLLEDGAPYGAVAWSPDGTSIAFTATRSRTDGSPALEISLLDLGTGAVTPLVAGSDPAWSPDGSRLVFAGGDGLFIVDADGTNLRRLTTGRHGAPAWRP